MGGGDLNMKKSWHPLLIKNQERVWKEEQKASEEQKKLNQLKKEKEEERQLQELRQIQESAGGRKGQERLDWMYAAGPNQSSSAKAQELEDYLLGKKRIDSLIEQGTSIDKLSADSKEIFSSISNPNANNYRDTQSKIREDPLFLIKKTEQANINNKWNKDSSSDHKEKSKKDKKRPLSGSEEESIMRLREQDRNGRSQKRPRLRSLSRSRSRSRDRYDDRHRYESKYSNGTMRDRNSHEGRHESRYSNRDRDTYDRNREGRNDRESRYNPRSYSPRRPRSPSSPSRREEYNRNNRKYNNYSHNRDYKERKEHNGRSERDKIKEKEEAERKLLEMMEDAKKRSQENGTQSDFLKNAYKCAYSSHSSIGLGERLQRHRGASHKISIED
ncbi:5574_t:CDS:2 [Rhizophagus irregularis]|nr:5574_t:CDS:2 [Rhizophagus irregularis]